MRNYAYGAFPPIENADLVHHQFRIGNSYQRALVAIERERRTAVDALYQAAAPDQYTEHVAARTAVEKAIEAARLVRDTGGDMLPPDDDMKAERRDQAKQAKETLASAREREKAARQAWYDARRRATQGLRDQLRALDQLAYDNNKAAYNLGSAMRLDWGTRLKLGESAERAGKAALLEGEGHLPRFPRFDGGGMIAVQLQGGIDPSTVMAGTDTQFKIDAVDAGTWQMLRNKSAFYSTKRDGRMIELPQPDPNSRRSQRRTRATGGVSGVAIARLRIGSNGRTPIWAAFPIVLHRPLPAGAPIKWAQVFARRVGPRTEWQLVVTIDDSQPALRSAGTTLAVNLGWRNLPDTDGEIRVAYAVGSDGHEEEVRVPRSFVSGMAHVASLTAIRKRNFNQAIKSFDEWIDENERPEWLFEEARYRNQWLAPKKLVRLLSLWRNRRFDGDVLMWNALSAWMKQDRHLWFWESDERLKLFRMRKDFYRTVAARWATRYTHILITDMDLRTFAEKPSPEAADTEDKVQRITQRNACPSELREAVENACSTRGTCCPRRVKRSRQFVEENACVGHASVTERLSAYKTQTCNVCGIAARFDARPVILNTCYDCRAVWDQDANHCRNLLASGQVTSPQADPLAPDGEVVGDKSVAAKSGRWQKRRSKKVDQMAETVKESG